MKKYQTIIIGASPGGSSAAIYLVRYANPVILIDARKIHGRTSMATNLENFLTTTTKLSGQNFLKKTDFQLKNYHVKRLDEIVVKVTRAKNNFFLVHTKSGKKLSCHFLILAIGFCDIDMEIKGLGPFYNKGIFHCITCDWWQNRHKKIAIISNNDSGINLARRIISMKRPPKIVVVPANKNSKYTKNAIKRVQKNGIEIYHHPIIKVLGENGYVKKVILDDKNEISVEVLFTNLGISRRDKFLDKGGIFPQREKSGFIKVNFKTYESSIKNLYAVGSCNNGPDQAIIAAGQGATATLHISKIIADEKINRK